MQDFLNDLVALSEEVTSELRNEKLDDLKKELEPLAFELVNLNQTKDFIAGQLRDVNKKIMEIESNIRKLWGPHILGTQKAEIDFGHLKLKTAETLNVTISEEEDGARDHAIGWLCENGYKDCMKYDINTNTLKSIASDLLKNQEVRIPGLKYTTFNKISIK